MEPQKTYEYIKSNSHITIKLVFRSTTAGNDTDTKSEQQNNEQKSL